MTAPTEAAPEVVEQADPDAGEWRVRFPVMALEGADTSDGRYLTPGTIIARACPLSILAQPFASHGGQEPPPAVVVGRLDTVERVPGPSVTSRVTGEPFEEGTFVWVGHGAVDPSIDVHGLNIGNLLKRRFLNGASVDLAGMDVEMVGEGGFEADPDNPRRQMIAHRGEQAAITLVPIPAFGDAYVELVGDDEPMTPADPEELPEGFCASAFPAWRSAEVGDYPALVAAGEQHTGGMIALVPADPEALTVDGGDPADELHLTLAYLGDDVAGWPEESRTTLLAEMDELVNGDGENDLRDPAPIDARVMGHALFNPDGGPDRDREPCAVYLIGDAPQVSNLHRIIRGIVEHKDGVPEQHDPAIFHVTAGYGLDLSALSFTGPVVFDRLRVALGGDVTDFPLGSSTETDPQPSEEETVVAAADTDDDLWSLRARWNPRDHPRDRRGRWIEKGGRVTLDDGTKGTVIDDDAGDGDVKVKADNGVQVRVRGSDIDLDDDGPDRGDSETGPPEDAEPASGGRAADKVTRARDRDELQSTVDGMSDEELRAADKELADRAAELGRPGAVSRGHQAVKDALKGRGDSTPDAPVQPAKPARKPRGDRGLAPPKAAPKDGPVRLPAQPAEDAAPPMISGSEAGRRAADRINTSSAPRLAVKEVSTPDLHAADYEMRRRAVLLGGNPDKVSKGHKVIKDELKKRGEQPIVASASTYAAEFPNNEPDLTKDVGEETGMPDAPQDCEATGTPDYESEVGPHPAVRSLLYDDGQRYAATCDEHDEWTREQIGEQGHEVEQVVEIEQADEPADMEVPA